MTASPIPLSRIASWHAHVYYDPNATRGLAETLREQVAARFAVQMGRWHDARVGPHPISMYQIAFDTALFATLVPFLALNRAGLTVLVHPNTGDPRADHLAHAFWMGGALDLDADVLPRSLTARDDGVERVIANTTPCMKLE